MLRSRVHLQPQPLPAWAEKDGREAWQCRRLEGLGLFSKTNSQGKNVTFSITTVQMYITERLRPLLGQKHAGGYATEPKPQVRKFSGIYQSPEELNGIQTESNLLSNWNSIYFWKTIQNNRMSHEVLELLVSHLSQSHLFFFFNPKNCESEAVRLLSWKWDSTYTQQQHRCFHIP